MKPESTRLAATTNMTGSLLGAGNEYFRLMADAMPHIVWTANADGRLDYFNNPWTEYTGLAMEASLESAWELTVHPEDLERGAELWEQAHRNGSDVEYEFRIKRGCDQAYRWHLGRARALKDAAGKIIKWIGSCIDIDVQKQAQIVLQSTVDIVEKQVKARTAEVLQTNVELLNALSERRRAAAIMEQDAQRLNEIIATQALLLEPGLDLAAFIELAARKTQHLTSATGASVEMIDGDHVVFRVATGSTAPLLRQHFRSDLTLMGICVTNREVLRCDNTAIDSRVNKVVYSQIEAASIAAAPLCHHGNPIGALSVVADAVGAFGERDVQTLKLMAGLIGAAMSRETQSDVNK